MAFPRKLKYLNLFNDGNSYLGVVSSLTLPKLTRKLENYRGGGMSGAAAIDFGLDDDALALEWTLGGIDELVLQQWGSSTDVPLRFAGAFQRDDTGEVSSVEVVMRGRHKEFDFGEYKQGEVTETKISTQCTYFKLTIDGKALIEVDTLNMVEIVNGVDRLAAQRTAIGL
ncbi:phage major tail tube protein [Chimaeribacter arupi]|uniref:phage major tail tube protein n=1 Tax=Chimaeribacter arupi TaxID=2060066 RepID=UPI0029480360|nr:phage major tail tube protein [Chimaeribacter arupi]MDV5138933.1 phage major tail tube protein [Chimaeribacter arupi]